MNRRSNFLIPAMILIAGLLSACVNPAPQNPEPSPTPGKRIDFSVKDLQGQKVDLNSLRGKVVLINYWATRCTPCKEEMPLLETFYQAHQDDNFVLIGLNVSNDVEDAAEFIAAKGYSYPIWTDPPGNTMIELGIHGLPSSILLDEDGILRWFWLGPVTEETLEQEVSPYLK